MQVGIIEQLLRGDLALGRNPALGPTLTWQQQWEKWNNEFPKGKCNDAQMMVSAYSRVRKAEDANEEWLEQIEEKLRVTQAEMEITREASEEAQR